MRAQSVDAVGRRVNDLSLSLPLPSSRERDAPHPGLDLGRVTDKFSDIANDSPAYLPSRRPTAYAERARETMAERRWPTANDDAFAREGGCMVRARKREREREKEKRKKPLGRAGRPASSCRHDRSSTVARARLPLPRIPACPPSDGENARPRSRRRRPLSRSRYRASRKMARRRRRPISLSRLTRSRQISRNFQASTRVERNKGTSAISRIGFSVDSSNKEHAATTLVPRISQSAYLRSNLVAALAGLDMDDFPHVVAAWSLSTVTSRESDP